MAYLGSGQIKMFPSAGRNPVYDSTSRLTTEYNLVNIVNRLLTTDEDGFVITSEYLPEKSLEFCIKGYYFNITEARSITDLDLFNDADKIYAYIQISAKGGIVEFSELVALNGSASVATESSASDTTSLSESTENSSDTKNSGYPLDVDIQTNPNFVGVAFDSADPGQGYYSLLILQKTDNGWEIPKESQVRYIINSPMGSTVTLKIDDGEL